MRDLITHPEDLSALVCRPALPLDTSQVMALTREIWDGHDYVPYVWQDWLADPIGLLVVAEYEGRVVGMVKLSRKGPGEWWLEGLRVHIDYQGRGIASHLHDYIVGYWQSRPGRVLRLATSSARLPVHHLCLRTGFLKLGAYRIYSAPAIKDKRHAFSPVLENQLSEALDYAIKSPLYGISQGLMYLSWSWGELTAERLRDAIAEGRALWWRYTPEGAAALVIIAIDEEDQHPYIQFAASSIENLADILVDYRHWAGLMGYERAVWLAPIQSEVLDALQDVGFQSEWENDLYLFEKRKPR